MLNKELAKVMQLPELRARLMRDGTLVVDGSSPGQFSEHMRAEKTKWSRVVQIPGRQKASK